MAKPIVKTFILAGLASIALVGMTLPNAASAQDRYSQGYAHTQGYGQDQGRSGRSYGQSNSGYDQNASPRGYNETYRESNRRGGYAQEERGYRSEVSRDDWGRSSRDRRETRWNDRRHHDWRWESDRRGW